MYMISYLCSCLSHSVFTNSLLQPKTSCSNPYKVPSSPSLHIPSHECVMKRQKDLWQLPLQPHNILPSHIPIHLTPSLPESYTLPLLSWNFTLPLHQNLPCCPLLSWIPPLPSFPPSFPIPSSFICFEFTMFMLHTYICFIVNSMYMYAQT